MACCQASGAVSCCHRLGVCAAAVLGKRGLGVLLLLLLEREFAFQAADLVLLALVVVLSGLLGGF